MNQEHDSPRRPVRLRNQPVKYGEYVTSFSPTKHRSEPIYSSEDEDITESPNLLKPTALFSNDDVEGHDIFKFKSRHTKQDLQNKVKAAVSNSPKVTESPVETPRKGTPLKRSTSRHLSRVSEATPKYIRDIIKKRIIKDQESSSCEGESSDEGDFSDSSNDFIPEESDDESESTSPSHSASEEENKKIQKPTKIVQIMKNKDNKMKPKDSEFIFTPDNYFLMNSSNKITTSDRTLSRLTLENLSLNDNPDETVQLSSEHQKQIANLTQSYEQHFNKWLFVLSENFNIILYGIGSKRSVLHEFQMQKLQDFPCMVVNGFFPSLTIKSVLETIVIDLLENSSVPSNVGDVVNLIDAQLMENDTHLFLIIHNIDGTMLRSSKAQAVLASISRIKNVHTIATIDHINAPLLWDHSKLSKFNFTWWDVTTFLPYTEETSFENSLMAQRSGALQLSSLRSVYQALTVNAKGIFNIIIQHQLDNHKQSHYQGLPFKNLYSKSREQFFVSSDVALRAQLTEFLDHKLVKMRRTYDGSENLIIPIESSLLQEFLDQQNSLEN